MHSWRSGHRTGRLSPATSRLDPEPGWWNWQTRQPQKLLSERACGSESRSGHFIQIALDPARPISAPTKASPHPAETLLSA
jgi:hypothetical protein